MKCIDCGTTIVETDEEKEVEAQMLFALELHKAREAELLAARELIELWSQKSCFVADSKRLKAAHRRARSRVDKLEIKMSRKQTL